MKSKYWSDKKPMNAMSLCCEEINFKETLTGKNIWNVVIFIPESEDLLNSD